MSDLENATTAVLDRWLNDGSRLSLGDLTTLRRWLAKTHLVLCALEGGIRRFMADPKLGVIPDPTLARLLYEDSDEAFDGVRFAGASHWGKLLVRVRQPDAHLLGPDTDQ